MSVTNRPIRILFVCHGNICRSPMAEFIFLDMVRRVGLADQFEIASAATTEKRFGTEKEIRCTRLPRQSWLPIAAM